MLYKCFVFTGMGMLRNIVHQSDAYVKFRNHLNVLFSSRRHRRWDGGSYGFYLRFFLASSFAYNFVRK